MMKLFIILLMLCFSGLAYADVDINAASAQELADKLTNVGPAKAAAIVEYRETHGNFQSVDDLLKVSGIGASTLEANRSILTASQSESSSQQPGMMMEYEATDVADKKRFSE